MGRPLDHRLIVLAASAWMLVWPGCAGLHVGQQSLYRPELRTIYVPVFESESFRPNLGERLTEAVVKEIELKTPYKVVATPNADSVLRGRIVVENKRVLAENAFDEPRNIATGMEVEVNWYDRQGGLILRNVSFAYSPVAFSVAQTSDLIPEAGQSVATAHQESVQELARQIVEQMEIPW
ncbi:MAG: LptE family protein [Pirellulaceae bacterium]|jgi:hypothetical protein|nr:LptE family protein [Pirellulaceae bacterium]